VRHFFLITVYVRACSGVSVLLAAVLHGQHHQRRLHTSRRLRRTEQLLHLLLPHRSARAVVLRLARLHQQRPQPRHLYHLQRRVSTGLQSTARHTLPLASTLTHAALLR